MLLITNFAQIEILLIKIKISSTVLQTIVKTAKVPKSLRQIFCKIYHISRTLLREIIVLKYTYKVYQIIGNDK